MKIGQIDYALMIRDSGREAVLCPQRRYRVCPVSSFAEDSMTYVFVMNDPWFGHNDSSALPVTVTVPVHWPVDHDETPSKLIQQSTVLLTSL